MNKASRTSGSSGDHSLEKIKEFFEEFDTESDRAAVVLGAARLDLLLYQILQRRLVPSAASQDELLDGDSPLSTLSSRIHIAYRLGLIDAVIARALHLIRRIRNGFAHELTSNSLSTGSYYDRIRELVAPMKAHKNFEEIQRDWFPKSKGAGKEFRAALALVALRLEGCFEDTNPISSADAWELIPPGWVEPQPTDKTDHEPA